MLKIRNIKIAINQDNIENILLRVIKKLNISNEEIIEYEIVKKSIDARKKENVHYVYEINIDLKNEEKVLKRLKSNDIEKTEKIIYKYSITGKENLNSRPIVVGSGPAGLFCAYFLAINNYKPLIIERGKMIDERIKDIEKFWTTGELNINSNVQFGEGGAGTFSDGKLNTGIKDKEGRIKEILKIFVSFGAPKEILYESKPHIGTDLLRKVIKNMREFIIKNGGEFRFNTTLTDIVIENNFLKQIEVNNSELLDCEVLVLALGHSARDTFRMLDKNKVAMERKNFAVGIRISHKQEMINKNQYGDFYKNLAPASYKLTYSTKDKRGVYSFCMCPGGFVVNSSSFDGGLVINGMSNYKRDEENANSAIVVSVGRNDFGDGLFSGMDFQEKLEKKAYSLGNGKIPIQKYIDFKENNVSTSIGQIKPVMKGNYTFANIREIFPEFINKSLIEGIEYFGTKIKGFDMDDSLIAAVESRTSSPIRIKRDENFNSTVKGIYPIGEGAGYAGGITSAAVDGIKCFEKIIKIYKK